LRNGDRRPPRKPDESERDPFGAARAAEPAADGPQRLQKVMAGAGIGSRRACEELIAAGRVTVDGRRAELGDRADPRTSVIHIDGERIVADTRLVYLALNKPRGIVSTMSDERGREGINELLGGSVLERVFHVGRLDTDSEGLLLLTNDGDLAHRLTHPSYEVRKTYLVEVAGPVPRQVGRDLLAGVRLEDGPAKADAFRIVDTTDRTALLEITLHEGRKHIVRRMLDVVGHPVSRLIRTAVGPVKLGDLRAGRWRRLSRGEVAALFEAAEASPPQDERQGGAGQPARDDPNSGHTQQARRTER
jgi:23S rRNA pseudouridine2605 synthase